MAFMNRAAERAEGLDQTVAARAKAAGKQITDAAAATTAYKTALAGAGFTIETEFDNLATDGGNIGFVASNGTWTVTASAFGPGPVDGDYMGVVVQPAA